MTFPARATEARRAHYAPLGLSIRDVEVWVGNTRRGYEVSYREVWGCALGSCRRCDIDIVDWSRPLTLEDDFIPIIEGIDMRATPNALGVLFTKLGFDLASRYYALDEFRIEDP